MNARQIIEAIDPKRILKQMRPGSEQLAGWSDLVELTNGAEFRVPGVGRMDMWSLMGYESVEMSDADQQTELFYMFIMVHKKETLRYYAAKGEDIKLVPDHVLHLQWVQSNQ